MPILNIRNEANSYYVTLSKFDTGIQLVVTEMNTENEGAAIATITDEGIVQIHADGIYELGLALKVDGCLES